MNKYILKPNIKQGLIEAKRALEMLKETGLDLNKEEFRKFFPNADENEEAFDEFCEAIGIE